MLRAASLEVPEKFLMRIYFFLILFYSILLMFVLFPYWSFDLPLILFLVLEFLFAKVFFEDLNRISFELCLITNFVPSSPVYYSLLHKNEYKLSIP